LADSTKIGHNHSFVSSAISQVDFLITDNGVNPEATQKLRDKGVKIVQVTPES
jgi:DeoR/GlpR family transcriptional regulator of sugar metabolism